MCLPPCDFADFVFLRTKMKPSLSGSSCPRLDVVLSWSSSILLTQAWLGPGMFVAVDVLVDVGVSGITVGDGVALFWVIRAEDEFLRAGCATTCGRDLWVPLELDAAFLEVVVAFRALAVEVVFGAVEVAGLVAGLVADLVASVDGKMTA